MNNNIINIKGTRNGLVICLDSAYEFEDLKKILKSKIESARGFFQGAKFVFHIGNPLSAEKTKELEDICCEHGLIPDKDINWPAPPPKESALVRVPESAREAARARNVRPLLREASPSLPSVGLSEYDKKPCMMIRRNLRSGQKINFNGNVVIMGDVNAGSEITAGGNIIVMGSLRGVVHAGADGDQDAIIMAYRLDPVQLRIASVISRPPENNKASTGPEIARLQQGRMFIEPYLTHGLK